MKKTTLFFLSIILLMPSITLAHPGRTDAYGCHTCRTNCAKWGLSTGEYHCHREKSLPQPKEPIKSHYDEDGGYTTPAPEYKQPAAAKPVAPKVKSEPKPSDNPVATEKKAQTQTENQTVNTNKTNESWITKLFKFLFN